jgi:hypothetical protein
MAYKQIVQMGYGIEIGHASGLWDINRLCRWVMAHIEVMQKGYGTHTGNADVLWHRNRLYRYIMAQKLALQMC